MDLFPLRSGLPMWTMWSLASVPNNHMAAAKVAAPDSLEPSKPGLQNLHRHAPEPSDAPEPSKPSRTCLRNLHQHAPEPSGTCLRNLHQHAPELSGTCRNPPEPSGTFRNLPPEPTPAHTGTCRNSPKPSGTCLWNLHQHTTEPSGTFRNLSPEPLSGTCSCDPHRHTPEFIWAEDPISITCWGKTPDRGCSISNLYMRFIMPYHGLSWLFLVHMYSLFSSFVCSCLLAICPNLQCVDTYDATITKAAFVIVNRRLKNWAVSSTHAHQTPCGSPQLASSQSTETAA